MTRPTWGHISWVTALVLALSAGCASTEAEDVSQPGDVTRETEPPREKEADDKPPAPAFNATFDPEAPKPDEDPAPPGGGEECRDEGDPGSAENVATKLADIDDCKNDHTELTGTMKGAVDVDFYKLAGTDKLRCVRDTDFEAQTAGTELCVFMRCKNSTTDAVKGCEQGSETTSEIGMKGCCAAAPGHAVPKWDCSGFIDNDSADIFLRVRQINGDKCLPYKVRYRF